MQQRKSKICYFGSKISGYGSSKASMETLEPLLQEFCIMHTYSAKKYKGAKLFDMLYGFFSKGIHSHKIVIDVFSTSAFYFALMLVILSGIFNKKYILFLRGGDLPKRYQSDKKKVAYMFRNATYVIAPSNYLKYFFESEGFTIKYIPNIIELHRYPFQVRENVRPKILALRGFGKPYNPLMTLKALMILKQKFPDIKLMMLGNRNEFYYDEVIDFVQLNQLNESVTIADKMPRDEWIQLSEGYDIMVSNPVIDNTPVSVLEGMALGMCVVTTNVGGVPHLLNKEDLAISIESDNETVLAKAIGHILDNNSFAKRLSENGRNFAAGFDWKYIKPLWMEVLQS